MVIAGPSTHTFFLTLFSTYVVGKTLISIDYIYFAKLLLLAVNGEGGVWKANHATTAKIQWRDAFLPVYDQNQGASKKSLSI